MAFEPLSAIRTRTREQWHQWLVDKVTCVRIWIQENSEKSFLVALIVGFCVAIFFKLFLYVLLLAIVAGVVIWLVALPEGSVSSSAAYSSSPRSGYAESRDGDSNVGGSGSVTGSNVAGSNVAGSSVAGSGVAGSGVAGSGASSGQSNGPAAQ